MSVKGFTYEISNEYGVFSFSADAGANTNAWFKKYSTPSAFEAEEVEYGSSWSWMGNPGAVNSPNSGQVNSEAGAALSVHQIPDGAVKGSFNSQTDGPFGLTWDGSYIYNSDRVNDVIRKFDISGTEKSTINIPSGNPDPRGLTWDGEYLWLMDNNTDTLYQFDRLGNQNSKIDISSSLTGGQGLTWDGSYFYVSESSSQVIYQFKTGGAKVNSFNLGVAQLSDISFDGKYFYVGDSDSSDFRQYNKGFGLVETFSSPTIGTRGVGWTGSYLLLASRDADTIYRITGSASLDISYRVSSIV